MRRFVKVLCASAILAPALSAPAGADVFEPMQLASAGLTQQLDYAHHPAISGDGRYVTFDGSFGAVIGVWRRDLLTGVVDPVVTCAKGTPPESPCAALPSISQDGRYVGFTTTVSLDPKYDLNNAPDVYVRDMNSSASCAPERAEGEDCQFTLGSARSESMQGLTYTYGVNPAFEESHYGSLASGRSALSADGRYIAFVTTAESDLHGEKTPRLEVAVRDLRARTTRLVSVRYDPSSGATTEEPVPAGAEETGAVYPGGSATPAFPSAAAALAGASISADGSTVAWMGQQIEEQAPLLAAEPNVAPGYTELLWRRIADGPLAPTRRVTGGGDPASPACAASGEPMPAQPPTLADPCQGPFDTSYTGGEHGLWILGASTADYTPRLSANGQVVAFVASAREIASGEPFSAAEASDDLYVTDMRSGLTRVGALRKLTELAGGNVGEEARTAPIVDLSVSPDGTEIAFATRRTVFPLGSPAFVSAPAPGLGAVEMFDIDLSTDTLTRVTQGFGLEPSEPASAVSAAPSFSADGNTLAFSSTASNLVYGDGNAPHGGVPGGFDGSDAFIVRRRSVPPTPTETYVSPAPPGPALSYEWRLYVTARSRRDGSVVLDVLVPGPGTLSARADSAVRVSMSSHAARRGRRRLPRTTVATRTVASASAAARAVGLTELTLKLKPAYGSLALTRRGLSATARLAFTAPGHAVTRQSIEVSFVDVARASRLAKRARTHRHRGSSVRGRR